MGTESHDVTIVPVGVLESLPSYPQDSLRDRRVQEGDRTKKTPFFPYHLVPPPVQEVDDCLRACPH